jgi:3-hydroxyacyl-CoA dehydrogenase
VGKDILRLDPASGEYVAGGGVADEVIVRILKKPAAERLKLLRESTNPQAQFLWAVLRDSFHYSAVHLVDVAECARDVDFAMRWGFGQAQGPFEIWQSAGWATVARWVQDDIDAGKALCAAPLPDWVFNGPVADGGGVHQAAGSWSAAQSRFVPPSTLPVYARQHFRESVFGSGAPLPLASGTEVFKTDELRVWTLDGEVLIASITAKLHLISPAVTEGLMRAVALAEESYQGLVVWSPDDVFSAGANLEALMPVFMKSGAKGVEPEERKLQELMLRVRYAGVPVVCAIRGMALGGGCELAVHSARRVAAMESYIGLVEMGVGLLPGAGGLTYIARRAAAMAAAGNANADLLTFLKDGFTSVAMAKVGTSAIEGRKLGYLLDADVIVPHKDELLFVAITQAKAIFNSGYQPPVKSLFPVAGRSAAATLKTQLVNMRDGGFITAHDFHIASLIAEVLCGGDVDAGSLVSEDYLMALERKHFCALLEHPKTQERIMGMLSTGKPVRN